MKAAFMYESYPQKCAFALKTVDSNIIVLVFLLSILILKVMHNSIFCNCNS